MVTKVSIIMSVYVKEDPIYLDTAISSIWTEQYLKPDQIVLVKDGSLTSDLEEVIDRWSKLLSKTLLVIKLDQNNGLAKALNVALSAATGDYIARMDTDDISTPDRFRKQVEFLNVNSHVDVVGSQISEIDENENIIKRIVRYPESHAELYEFFSMRDPLAHPSVMFRRAFFDKAGLYSEVHPLFEDTYLWFQGFRSGCIFANLDSVCLMYRRSQSFYTRRADLKKAIRLLRVRLFTINRQLKFSSMCDLYAILYFLMSLLPVKLKKVAYQYFR